MVDPTSSPETYCVAETAPADKADPELVRLPPPRRRARTVSLVLLGLTALVSVLMAANLWSDAAYAFLPTTPRELGDLTRIVFESGLKNRFVRGEGSVALSSGITYERPLEGDSFSLAPLSGNSNLWVELRIPAGFSARQFLPPSTFVGRLVPLADSSFQHRKLQRAAEVQGGVRPPEGAWLLVDGATPPASRWTVALSAMLALFAIWSVSAMARMVRPVRG